MMEHFDQVVCDPRLRLRDLEAHMEGPDPLGFHLDRYQVCGTSGSTGLRGVFVYTQRELDAFTASIMRVAARAGVTAGTPHARHRRAQPGRRHQAAVRRLPVGHL
jgi:phenylacetate-CoA ligase